MFGKIISADVRGIEGYGVSVEADISEGMPVFLMVGYLASEVREKLWNSHAGQENYRESGPCGSAKIRFPV